MYVLTDQTAQKLRALLGSVGGAPNTLPPGSSARLIRFVRCVSWDRSTHQGTGVVVERDASGWTDFGVAADMLLLTANDEDLTAGKRYLAVRYGETDGKTIFVAVNSQPAARHPLGNPCLVRGAGGAITGLAQRWVETDGRVRCVAAEDCACPSSSSSSSTSSSSWSSSSSLSSWSSFSSSFVPEGE